MLKVGFKTPQAKSGAIEGLLIADKVGEIHFLNIKNLPQLAEDPSTVPSRNDPAADAFNYVAKLIYGHMQTCTSLQSTPCGKYVVSTDTMNKVVINNFPNMFNIQSVNTDQQSTLEDLCLFGDKIATIS